MHADILMEQPPSADAGRRMLNVIRWVLSSLNEEPFGKKPYNPVLGQTPACAMSRLLLCCFVSKRMNRAGEVYRGVMGETVVLAEQVSHHPPGEPVASFSCSQTR